MSWRPEGWVETVELAKKKINFDDRDYEDNLFEAGADAMLGEVIKYLAAHQCNEYQMVKTGAPIHDAHIIMQFPVADWNKLLIPDDKEEKQIE